MAVAARLQKRLHGERNRTATAIPGSSFGRRAVIEVVSRPRVAPRRRGDARRPCPGGGPRLRAPCCLPTGEAAARELARQQPWFDDDVYGDPEFDVDDDDEEFFDIEDDEFVLDGREITRVRYTRDSVRKVSDLRSGRGVQVTEWEARGC